VNQRSVGAHKLVDVSPLPPAIGYSPAVVAAPGRHVFLGGQAAQSPDGQIVGSTITEQFDVAAANMLTALRAVGGIPEDLVSIMIYVTDVQEYRNASREISPIYRRHFGQHYPAITMLGVSQLFDEGALIELVGTAVIPERGVSLSLTCPAETWEFRGPSAN
jgi:enamine deaminase RidA (YjgF/YER057c/UK114 family)